MFVCDILGSVLRCRVRVLMKCIVVWRSVLRRCGVRLVVCKGVVERDAMRCDTLGFGEGHSRLP